MMTILDEGYESGEDPNNFAKEVDVLLEQPIEGIIHKTKRELSRIQGPSIRPANESHLKALLVHRAAIQAYTARSELKRCRLSGATRSTFDIDDAKLRSMIHDIVQECNHAISTSQALLALEESKRSQNQVESMLVLTRMTFVFLPVSFLASFFGMNMPPSALMIVGGFTAMAVLLSVVLFGWKRMAPYVRGISLEILERLGSFKTPWRAREIQDLEQTGGGPFVQAREKQDPEKLSLAEVAVQYSGMKTSRCNMRNVEYGEQGNNHPTASNGRTSTACSQESAPPQYVAVSSEVHNSQPKSKGRSSCQGLKRKRQDMDSDEGRFPCIYFVGDESGCFASHTKRHAFISQLLRHLRTHDFFACPKCFTRFSTEAEEQDHQLTPCVKACRNRKCKRHCTTASIVRPAGCDPCITTAEMQWSELFKLEYPDKAIPADLFSFEQIAHRRSSSDNSGDFILDEYLIDTDNAESQPTLATADTDQADQVGWGTMPSFFEDSENFTLNHDQANNQEPEPDLNSAFELLPMASTRSDREQDLEAALSLVWDALRRSGSSEGLPGSSAHRVLQRLAPELLD